ncbi:MAG TPA: DCC1-like thiol-disulfide oxidoreductase family protein [Candidatus Dormibacteraeota bacterium]|nr:DCC1-like thiol-disulfide oxidoreductase family protein [Candidatus Dormibacteraeota bacterium]
MTPAVILYDGVCGFCDRTVRFVLRHDPDGRFRFAPLQSAYAAAALARHGRDAGDLDSVALLLEPDTDRERLLARSDAVLAILRRLGGAWRLAALARWLPRGLRDAAYDAFARRRYRWFGRFDQCPIPSPELRARLAVALDEEGARRRSTA